MLYVGLDVHWKTSTLCILDANGQEVKCRTFTHGGGWQALLRECQAIQEPFSVAFEASCGYGYLHDELAKLARHVVVAHPGQVRLIFRSKRKNDRVDSRKLAKLLYLGEVPPVHVPSTQVRQWREMIEYRQAMVAKRVRTKNALRALLRGQGIAAPRGLWTGKGQAWLKTIVMDGQLRTLRRDMLLEELELFSRQIANVTRQLDVTAGAHAGVSLLRTIPGVGPRTAEAFVAYVDQAHRFGSVHSVGAYLGMVPCQDSSAGVNRLGHITREGPATARKLLVEASWQMIRRSPRVRELFERLCHGKKERRKTALVAVARHAACWMISMLQSGECWREAA